MEKYQVTNFVYDPYNRSVSHNDAVLALADRACFDTVTSNSVLNVISHPSHRAAHIRLAWSALKPNGKAYFKVYRGDDSGVPFTEEGKYNANRGVETYLKDVEDIFGSRVRVDVPLNLIVAWKE
eukprot:TRINITY_DN11852_c0_g1_i3.p2 TRINITY_DN11852_c0_g1~~TRINITY_DN11852_c0_g1_i3.p2  ORF type:complete len:124 (+),score=23.68 TRINITY_DN11852_c0_g1_i3:525-896(+)